MPPGEDLSSFQSFTSFLFSLVDEHCRPEYHPTHMVLRPPDQVLTQKVETCKPYDWQTSRMKWRFIASRCSQYSKICWESTCVLASTVISSSCLTLFSVCPQNWPCLCLLFSLDFARECMYLCSSNPPSCSEEANTLTACNASLWRLLCTLWDPEQSMSTHQWVCKTNASCALPAWNVAALCFSSISPDIGFLLLGPLQQIQH